MKELRRAGSCLLSTRSEWLPLLRQPRLLLYMSSSVAAHRQPLAHVVHQWREQQDCCFTLLLMGAYAIPRVILPLCHSTLHITAVEIYALTDTSMPIVRRISAATAAERPYGSSSLDARRHKTKLVPYNAINQAAMGTRSNDTQSFPCH